MATKKLRVGIYARVSKESQNNDNQLLELQRVAEQRGWEVIEVYQDHVSGAKKVEKRPAFQRMLTDAGKGRINHIAAWALDRCGRSGREVINFFSDLPEIGVSLYLHKEQLDTSTAVGRLVLTIMAGVAEMERERIIERINLGLARARAQGKKFGRPTVAHKVEGKIREMLKAGTGKVKIARTLGVGVSTVQRLAAAA